MDATATTETTTETSTTTGTAPTATHRLVVALLVPLLAVLGLLVATPAQAYTTTSRSGVPVLPTIYVVQGAHHAAGSAVTGPMHKPWIFQSGPVVSRTGAGAQSVRVVYKLDRWNGTTWVHRHTASGSTSIPANLVSAKAPDLSILPADGSGYYRVRLELTWTSAVGGYLGHLDVTMGGAGDYRCSTTRTCSVQPAWVYLGA